MSKESLTNSFLQTLYPLSAHLSARRTLSPGKLGVLRHLEGHGNSTTTELAAILHVSTQGISLAVRELERLGFVARIPDPEDRRRIRIELTDAGREGLAEELAAGHGWMDRALKDRLTEQERRDLEAIVPLLRKLGSESPRG
ncbi:MarR family transcriptional regulator [Paeniglutamicibacter cryotolerans]|uniref:DNA-binding MarR family transcriptional regulator n=1 Tax=Paeniglutamicibacter cryotolerans TaxID=670079 RepID=A0A839QMB2_9MICC|nr:DNA-binding MarR family transcriptional regulator [Paeniglutamicibacter cryotolerans]